jgi:hypothetical protein
VRPSIEYASDIWDPFNKNQISQLSKPRTRSSYIYNLQPKMGIP